MCPPKKQPEDGEARIEIAGTADAAASSRFRGDVERAARFMIRTYGSDAHRKAVHMEETFTATPFAAAVTLAVARLLAETDQQPH